MTNGLSSEMRRDVQRLGGAVAAIPPEAPTEIRGHALSPLLRELCFGVRWPEGRVAYRNDDDDDLHVWTFSWELLQWLDGDEHEVVDRGERPICILGIADGGNYLVCVRLDDPRPDDPEITRIDHYDPDQAYDACASMRLSAFLASLVEEGS